MWASSSRRMTTRGYWPSSAEHGSLSEATRRRLARDAFAHTAGYDAAIVEWLDERETPPSDQSGADLLGITALLPPTIHLTLEHAGSLRYGENPHQHAARYRIAGQHSWWEDDGPARRQGALVPQHLRRRCGVATGPRAPRPRRSGKGGGHHQARQPVRRRPRRRPGRRLPACTGVRPDLRVRGDRGHRWRSDHCRGRGDRGRAPGRCDHRHLLRRGGSVPADLQAQGHQAARPPRPPSR